MTGRCIYEKKNENGENGILFEDHLRSGQGRAGRIDKLDGARTMMDDQMMPECQPSSAALWAGVDSGCFLGRARVAAVLQDGSQSDDVGMAKGFVHRRTGVLARGLLMIAFIT